MTKDRIAVVTGANRGIGAAVAERLARVGFVVVLLARRVAALAEVEDKIRSAGERFLSLPCDVALASSVEAATREIERRLGSPCVLVNNAGLGGPHREIHELEEADWDRIFATNVKSIFLFCRAFLPGMAQEGFGRVINIGSVLSHAGATRSAAYAASKHAVVGLTRSLAGEWGKHGITCNVVSPGYVETRMGIDPVENQAWIQSRVPAGRIGLPEEIAEVVASLAAPELGYVNGAEIVVDGGLTADLALPDPS